MAFSSLGNTVNNNEHTCVLSVIMNSPQWYISDPELYREEKEVMKMKYPDAKEGRLEDGRMIWEVTLKTILSPTSKNGYRSWTFLIVYDPDHPSVESGSNTRYSARWSGSIKVYPVDPSYDELEKIARRYNHASIPHTLIDSFNNHYLCTFRPEQFEAGMRAGTEVLTGASALTQAIRWATAFEIGLTDNQMWLKFSEH